MVLSLIGVFLVLSKGDWQTVMALPIEYRRFMDGGGRLRMGTLFCM